MPSKTLDLDQDDDVISVGKLNKLAKSILENHLPIVWVKGEVSGLKRYAHLYFDLKDETAKVSCVMFAKLAEMVDFDFENGTKIEVRGRVTLYPQTGSYQINVERMRKVGLGELWEAYNKLIVKLREEGLFEQKYKKPLPQMPKAIGVITSREGAVIRDVITTLKRRIPHIPIVVYHSAVQGNDSAMQIAKAIRLANQRNEVDVLILCRGGGSMEDLWSFNEEVVAREIFNSLLPIISAIGHETDTTIADFVADLRAPTPTAAAELVAVSSQEWLHKLDGYKNSLEKIIAEQLNYYTQKIDVFQAKLISYSPQNKLTNQQQMLTYQQQQLTKAFTQYLKNKQLRVNLLAQKILNTKLDISKYNDKLASCEQRFTTATHSYYKVYRDKLTHYNEILEAISPYKILQRGYAIVEDNHGKIVTSITEFRHHSKVNISVGDGVVSAIVDKKVSSSQNELL